MSKLRVLCQKLVIVFTTRAEANLIHLVFKISVLKKLSLFVPIIVLKVFLGRACES